MFDSNNARDQERHSLARFNANCYRRLAYKRMHAHQDCTMLEGKNIMKVERVLGIPAVFFSRRYI